MHTIGRDGSGTVREMVEAAMAKGYTHRDYRPFERAKIANVLTEVAHDGKANRSFPALNQRYRWLSFPGGATG